MTEITWTAAGRKHAAANGLTTEDVEYRLQEDIARGDLRPSSLISHAVEIGADLVFLVSPSDDRTGFVIDGAKWERCEVLDEGPFKGRAVMMPRPMTGDA